MTKWTSIAWRKRNDWIDFYQTPVRCVEELLKREKFVWNIFEPCSWAGAISKELEYHWYKVYSQDIRTDTWVYWLKWKDFFEENSIGNDNIITNPPYFCAKEFIEKSLDIAQDKVCMLLKLSFLESKWRYEFFKNTPLKKVYVFCKRVTMHPEWQPKPKNSWTIAYAWYVREKWYKWEPIIDWIN
jgi:hypothetical protein